MKIFPLKIHEWLFLFAGFGMLASLPWIEEVGFLLWTLAKISYFTGLLFFVANIRKKSKKEST